MAFRLHSGDSDFNTRVDALFSSLQTAAKELEPQMKRDHDEIEEEEDSGKRQCFSRPQGRPPQWRGGRGGRGGFRGGSGPRNPTPDYIKNPQKWTQYSMRDTDVLTDAENKQEGLRLFADLTRDKTEDEEMESDGERKIIFKKPTASQKTEDAAVEEEEKEETQELVNSRKFYKPEYVVGKMKKKAKEKIAKVTKGEEEEEEGERGEEGEGEDEEEGKKQKKKKKEVKLSYLMFEEED